MAEQALGNDARERCAYAARWHAGRDQGDAGLLAPVRMDEAAFEHGGAQAKRASGVVMFTGGLAHALTAQRAGVGDD